MQEADPAWFDALLARYAALVEKGEAAIEAGDFAALGGLLDENHALCQVSKGRRSRSRTRAMRLA